MSQIKIKNCPCGLNLLFNECCLAFINLSKYPQSPEQLMRSRFSAYVNHNAQYIYDTYAIESQTSQSVDEIQNWAKECYWVALVIHNRSDINKTYPSVEFSAFYIIEDQLIELRENSRFIKEPTQSDHWRYLDGEIIKNDKIATIKRNETCPCNLYQTAFSLKKNKKFKHCCGR